MRIDFAKLQYQYQLYKEDIDANIQSVLNKSNYIMGEEIDLPSWWQSKITTAENNITSAKEYLEFELKEPAIDSMVSALSENEDSTDEAEKLIIKTLEDEGNKTKVKSKKAIKCSDMIGKVQKECVRKEKSLNDPLDEL